MPRTPDMAGRGGRGAAALLVARLCMASLFLWSGAEKLARPGSAAGFAVMHGVPAPMLLIPVAALFELAAGAMLVTGWHARSAALALALWMLVLGPWFHPFWAAPPPMWQPMIDSFFHHFVMIGGMIYLVVVGPGPLSLRRAAPAAKFGRQRDYAWRQQWRSISR